MYNYVVGVYGNLNNASSFRAIGLPSIQLDQVAN